MRSGRRVSSEGCESEVARAKLKLRALTENDPEFFESTAKRVAIMTLQETTR
jgi:hypothetical protein